MQKGDTPSALRILRLIETDHPQYGGNAALRQAQIHSKENRPADALAAYRRVLKAHPGTRWAQRARSEIALLLSQQHKPDDALAEYRRLLAGCDDSEERAFYRYMAAQCYIELLDGQKALAELKLARKELADVDPTVRSLLSRRVEDAERRAKRLRAR